MLQFRIPVPPSANNLFVNAPGKGRVKSAEYREWISKAGWLARTATVGMGMLKPRYKATYLLPRSTKGDIANREKATSDLLVALQIIKDDSLIDKLVIERADRDDMLVTVESL